MTDLTSHDIVNALQEILDRKGEPNIPPGVLNMRRSTDNYVPTEIIRGVYSPRQLRLQARITRYHALRQALPAIYDELEELAAKLREEITHG